MKFAITGLDWTIGVFRVLLNAGWEPVKFFTFPVKDPLYSNEQSIELALSLGIPVQISKMTDSDLYDLGKQNCDILVSAAYPWLIGDWQKHITYGINFHPSPLPLGRGPRPQIRAILDDYKSWGVSAHKLSPRFDDGDLLGKETFALSQEETHESLNLKCLFAFDKLAGNIADNFTLYWENASPQGEAEYWKRWTKEEQTIDLNQPTESILRHFRAFGLNGSFVEAEGKTFKATRAAGWKEEHEHKPGTVIKTDGNTRVIASSDGYIALIEWTPAS